MSTPRVLFDAHTRNRILDVVRWPGARADALVAADVASRAALAEFLEDTVIRALPVDARDGLRRGKASVDVAVDALNAYGAALTPAVRELGAASADACVDALLERAVALKHDDVVGDNDQNDEDVDALERVSKRLKLSTSAEDVRAALTSEKGRRALEALAKTLGVASASDNFDNYDALDACVMLERCVEANERFVVPFSDADGAAVARNPPSLDDVPSGVGLDDDAVVDTAVRVARLLHVNDLRRLQSDADALLVAMQEYTADPKTDSRIGRVGK